MCFSAEASFVAAAALVPMGGYCLVAAARRRPRLWPFALLPVGFGLQQAAEGVVWLGLANGWPTATAVAAGVFLFFAVAWWPFWFPFAAARAVRRPAVRRLLVVWALLATGWFFLAYLPVLADGTPPVVAHHSIRYPYPDGFLRDATWGWPVLGLYLLCTVGPLLVAGLTIDEPRHRFLFPAVGSAAVTGLAAVVAAHAYTSVWCFFAALLSAYCVYYFATAGASEPA